MSRKVFPTNQFKRDIKKQAIELATPAWAEVLYCLSKDIKLPIRYRDHA